MNGLVERLLGWIAGSTEDDALACGAPGCGGDARYSPPGRGHVKGCLWVGDF